MDEEYRIQEEANDPASAPEAACNSVPADDSGNNNDHYVPRSMDASADSFNEYQSQDTSGVGEARQDDELPVMQASDAYETNDRDKDKIFDAVLMEHSSYSKASRRHISHGVSRMVTIILVIVLLAAMIWVIYAVFSFGANMSKKKNMYDDILNQSSTPTIKVPDDNRIVSEPSKGNGNRKSSAPDNAKPDPSKPPQADRNDTSKNKNKQNNRSNNNNNNNNNNNSANGN